MKFPYILVLLILSNTCAQDFTLPDLGINTDEITCQNADSLLATAESDLSRLESFVNQELADGKAAVQEATRLSQRICDSILEDQDKSLLEVQKPSKQSRSTSTTLQKLTINMGSIENKCKLLLADKFAETTA